jgi:hypothetical protein
MVYQRIIVILLTLLDVITEYNTGIDKLELLYLVYIDIFIIL